MKFDNPKNHLYYFFVPSFLTKKLSLQELFLQKRSLPRYDRIVITNWEKRWKQIDFGTYVGTTVFCLHRVANSDMMMKYRPSGTVARLGVLALMLIVLSDVGKVAYFYDNNQQYVDSLIDRSGLEVYNPYKPE